MLLATISEMLHFYASQVELEAAKSEIQKWHSAFQNIPAVPAGTNPGWQAKSKSFLFLVMTEQIIFNYKYRACFSGYLSK